ncbi:MAG: hypothetical protein WCP91_04180, partial [Candidatus Berkelbacteria bacterium]
MKFHDLKIFDDVPEDWSQFFDFREDLGYLKREAAKIDFEFENVVVIGNGGSITSFNAYSICTSKNTFIINSMDPALLRKVKSQCKIDNTVVVAVSKSGNTLGVIEALMDFTGYKIVVVTEGEEGTLRQIANKMNWQIVEHPNISGRYSGATAAGLF